MASMSCPSCGAEVVLRFAAPFCVCRYCQSLLARSDATFEKLGTVSAVPDDFSPLQLGSQGRYEGRHFVLGGRLRREWEEGSWSEWAAYFDDQGRGWLAESQGDWLMCFEVEPARTSGLPAPFTEAAVALESTWRIDGQPYQVTDIKQTRLVGCEGELPGSPRPGQPVLCVDLRGPGVKCATVEGDGGAPRTYAGRFVTLSELQMSGLRSLPGWDRAGLPA